MFTRSYGSMRKATFVHRNLKGISREDEMWRMKGILPEEKSMRLTCIPESANKSEGCELVTDKNSLNQTWARQLNSLSTRPHPWNVCKNPIFQWVSLVGILCPQYLISDHPQCLTKFLIPYHPPGDVWSLWLAFRKNHVRSTQPKSHLTHDVSS